MTDTDLGRRIKELERKLPRAATVEVPGPWAGEVTVSTQGQLAVQRVVQGASPTPWRRSPSLVWSARLSSFRRHARGHCFVEH